MMTDVCYNERRFAQFVRAKKFWRLEVAVYLCAFNMIIHKLNGLMG